MMILIALLILAGLALALFLAYCLASTAARSDDESADMGRRDKAA